MSSGVSIQRVSVKDVLFDVKKDFYNNRLLNEDEIEVLKVAESLDPTIIASVVEDDGSSTERTIRVSIHTWGVEREMANEEEEVANA